MKKFCLFIVLVTITFLANAKVLRVSNVSGSSAPYTNYSDAERDAVDGDTIMFEGSATPYCAERDTLRINKRVTIKGPGYFLVSNEISNENGAVAEFSHIRLSVDGITISGVVANKMLIATSNNVVVRNHIGDVIFGYNTTKNVIHQNYIRRGLGLFTSYPKDDAILPSYIQITNNIFTGSSRFEYIDYATIKNNTFTTSRANTFGCFCVSNTTYENNLGSGFAFDENNGCICLNNLKLDDVSPYAGFSTDNDVYEIDINVNGGIYGAFAGEDPYVLSGVPVGPIIEDIELPASVERGKDLNVNVKIGISQ